MTKPAVSHVFCEACGRKVGTRPGTQVVFGVVCNRDLCNYQGAPPLNARRDGFVVAGFRAGIPVRRLAAINKVSRQRVYQILDTWKAGV